MKKSVKIVLAVLALILVAAGILGGVRYKQYLDEEQRKAEIAAIYANPNVVLTVTEENFSELDKYTDLQTLDLSGSTCYDRIVAFVQARPEVKVSYTVELGGTTVAHDTATLELAAGSFDYETLMKNLCYLPGVTSVTFPATELSYEQISALRSAYPQVDIRYNVAFLDTVLEEGTTDLDISAMTPEQTEELLRVLDLLPVASSLQLMNAEGGSNFSMTDVKALMDACPGLAVNYSFDFFGNTLTTADERVEFNRLDLSNEDEAFIRQTLDILPNCTYFKLDDCGIDSTVMASIREDYPNTKVVWRVFFGKFNCLTDAEMLRLTNGLKDSHVAELYYCNDVKYLDVGHNEPLTDIGFIKYMPKLEICILSGSLVSDLTPFQDHQNIEFLEMCFCSLVADLSPLTNCPNLKFLNISYTKVRDLEYVYDMPLERFNCMQNRIPMDQREKFEELHPDCMTRFTGTQCYGYAWRYDDDGITFSDYYANMRVIFMYDDAGYVSGKEYKR